MRTKSLYLGCLFLAVAVQCAEPTEVEVEGDEEEWPPKYFKRRNRGYAIDETYQEQPAKLARTYAIHPAYYDLPPPVTPVKAFCNDRRPASKTTFDSLNKTATTRPFNHSDTATAESAPQSNRAAADTNFRSLLSLKHPEEADSVTTGIDELEQNVDAMSLSCETA